MSRRRSQPSRGALRVAGIGFGGRELRDLGIAWVALSIAFAIFFSGGGRGVVQLLGGDPLQFVTLVVVSLITAGLGFVLHEIAHKVVAVRFGQVAAFRANYQMLGIALISSLAGIIFAAPGAVHHSGRITDRERGLVALAGPVSNVALVGPFAILFFGGVGGESGFLFQIGLYGTAINALLAGFNMLPFGPLDGASVLEWSTVAYVATAVPTILLGASVFWGIL